MEASQGKSPSTKERLASIVEGFDSFDSEMKIGTRVSKQFYPPELTLDTLTQHDNSIRLFNTNLIQIISSPLDSNGEKRMNLELLN
jgi:hypothetical protein